MNYREQARENANELLTKTNTDDMPITQLPRKAKEALG